MAGLFQGIVSENPLYVDNSEKYAKRAEVARDEAVKSATEAFSAANIAKSESEAARIAAERIDAVGKDVTDAHAHIHQDKSEVSANTSAVADDRVTVTTLVEEARVLDGKFEGDKITLEGILTDVTTKGSDVTVKHADVVVKHQEVVASTAAAKQSEVNAKASETLTTANLNASNATLADVKVTQSRVEAFQGEVITARDVAVSAKDVAVSSKDAAKSSETKAAASESLSKTYADSTYELYEDLRKGQVYRGPWNPKSNAYPDHKDTNSVWDVNLDTLVIRHNFDGKMWNAGDRLIYVLETKSFHQIKSGSTVLSVNGKSGAVTLNAADVGAVNKTGDTMTGALNIRDANKYIDGYQNDLYIAAKAGTMWFETKTNPAVKVNGVAHFIYHQGFKPTAAEVGALPITGGNLTGEVTNTSYFRSRGGFIHYNPTTNLGLTLSTNKAGYSEIVNIVASEVPEWLSGLRAYGGIDWRIGTSKLYHEGFKPTALDIQVTDPRTKKEETLMEVIASLTARIEELEARLK